MVILLDLWENTKPAAADTATAGEQNNSRQHDEEVIEFDSGSDAEAEVRARQLTTEELGGGYEIVDNTTPAAAAAHLLLLQRPSSHKRRLFPPSTTAPRGLSTSPTTATAPFTPRGSAAPASQPRRSPAETSDSALLKAVAQRWETIKGNQAANLQEFTWQNDIEKDTAKGEAFKLDVLQVTP
jgi:hypothetical protein